MQSKQEDAAISFVARQECKLGSLTKKAFATSQKLFPRRSNSSRAPIDLGKVVEDFGEYTTAQDLPSISHSGILSFLLNSMIVKNIAIRCPGETSETFSKTNRPSLSDESINDIVVSLMNNDRIQIDPSNQHNIDAFLTKCCPEGVKKLVILQHRGQSNLEHLITQVFEDNKPSMMIEIPIYGKTPISEATLEDINKRKDYILGYFLSKIDLVRYLRYTSYCCLVACHQLIPSMSAKPLTRTSKQITKSIKSIRMPSDLKTFSNDRRPDMADFRIITKRLMADASMQASDKLDAHQQDAKIKAKVDLVLNIDTGDLKRALLPKVKDNFFDQYQPFRNVGQALKHVNNSNISLRMVSGKTIKTNALMNYYDLSMKPLSSSKEALVNSSVRSTVVIATDYDLRDLVIECFLNYQAKHQSWHVMKSPSD